MQAHVRNISNQSFNEKSTFLNRIWRQIEILYLKQIEEYV